MAITDETYSQAYYAANGQSGDRPALALFERLAKRYISPGRVMDFGCGTGALLRRLGRSFDGVGVEASDWARAAAVASGLNVTADTLGLEAASLSGIVSVHVVEHIDDIELPRVLSEWHRILKPCGRVIVITPDADGYAARRKAGGWIALTDPTHINLKGCTAWRQVFTQGGFDVLACAADGLWDFPYRWKWMGRLEVLLLGWPTLIQFVAGRLLLRPGTGESCIFVLQRR